MRMERSIHHCHSLHRCWWWWWRHRHTTTVQWWSKNCTAQRFAQRERGKITFCNICSLCPTTTIVVAVVCVVNADAFVCQKNAAVFIAHSCASKMLHQHSQFNKQSTSSHTLPLCSLFLSLHRTHECITKLFIWKAEICHKCPATQTNWIFDFFFCDFQSFCLDSAASTRRINAI